MRGGGGGPAVVTENSTGIITGEVMEYVSVIHGMQVLHTETKRSGVSVAPL